jgi:hypothetical protein
MKIRRYAFIQYCVYTTVLLVAVAVVIRLIKSPPGPMGGDVFTLVSPVFLGVAAKNASRFGAAAAVLAFLGVVLAVGMLWTAWLTGAPR